jgi:hypothetical protein
LRDCGLRGCEAPYGAVPVTVRLDDTPGGVRLVQGCGEISVPLALRGNGYLWPVHTGSRRLSEIRRVDHCVWRWGRIGCVWQGSAESLRLNGGCRGCRCGEPTPMAFAKKPAQLPSSSRRHSFNFYRFHHNHQQCHRYCSDHLCAAHRPSPPLRSSELSAPTPPSSKLSRWPTPAMTRPPIPPSPPRSSALW